MIYILLFKYYKSFVVQHGFKKKMVGIGSIGLMILQICSDYQSLPDFRTLSLTEIEFFYNSLEKTLIEMTKK